MNKKKVLLTGMALTGALLASASVAKANAFMELISGSSKIKINPGLAAGIYSGNYEAQTGNGAIFVGTVGTWSVDIASGAQSGAFNITLTDNINGTTTQSKGLEVIFSSGSYDLSGGYNFGASDSGGNSLTAQVSGYYSSSLYMGSNSLGTSLGSWVLGKTYAASDQNTNILLSGTKYITETMLFGGTTGSITPQTVTMNATASFTPYVPSIPDGGGTFAMAGFTLLGMVTFRTKFRSRRI